MTRTCSLITEAGDTATRPRRFEIALLSFVVAAGALLRVMSLSHAAVEHFDEGVYTSNVWFSEPGGHYPACYLYAPPLLPAALEWSIAMFGSGHWGTMSINLIAGIATIVLVWWVGRCWFGAPSGIAAATLAAMSDFHILYSRTALTDPLLGFWMLAAVYLSWEALRRRCVARALAAGLVTALAWWTKYNGWLPLAVGIAGLLPWLVFAKLQRTSIVKLLGIWFLIAVTAVVLWSPVLFGLKDFGGYAAVQANHRGYLVGLNGWSDSLLRQIGSHRYLDGWLSGTSVGLAVLLGALLQHTQHARFTWNSCVRCLVNFLPLAVCATAVAIGVGSSPTLGCGALLGLSLLLYSLREVEKLDASTRDRSLGCWLTAAWFCGLLAATPWYLAYPRLTLPWLIAAWLGSAALLSWLFDRTQQRREVSEESTATTSVWRQVGLIAIGGLVIVLSAPRLNSRGIVGWQDRTGLETVAGQIAEETARQTTNGNRKRSERAIYVFGEPALVYHIGAQLIPVAPVADLAFAAPDARRPAVPVYLVAGPHAFRNDTFNQALATYASRFELIDSYAYRPSDLVLLNQHSAKELLEPGFDPIEMVRLYRLK